MTLVAYGLKIYFELPVPTKNTSLMRYTNSFKIYIYIYIYIYIQGVSGGIVYILEGGIMDYP